MVPYSRLLAYSACAVMLVLAVAAAGCSSYPAPSASGTPTPVPAPAADTVIIKGFAFSPSTLTVKAGTTVTWTNQDSVPHSVVADTGAPVTFASGTVSSGGSYTFTFAQAGSYPYHCSIHPSMKGMIVVQS